MEKNEEKFAIRFGLGAIKAVGFAAMETAVKERTTNGKFKDIFNLAERLDPKSINKKSIEALAKSGSLTSLNKNRRQVAESFDILSSYAIEKSKECSTNQMNLFGSISDSNLRPTLKKTDDWTRDEYLQKEFEAFGFFLNEHPLDKFISDLKKRGVIFSQKLDNDELEDGHVVKMAGVIAASKHRSGGRGRFAYLTISDPYGIFEAIIFDESIITNARDILTDGTSVVIECLIKRDSGGTRKLVRSVIDLQNFITNTKAANEDFEDIKKTTPKNDYSKSKGKNDFFKKKEITQNKNLVEKLPPKKILETKIIEIEIRSQEILSSVKSILLQKVRSPLESSEKQLSKVCFLVEGKRIILPQNFLLTERDLEEISTICKTGLQA